MWLKSIKVVTWVASIGLVTSALYIAYIVLFPVDVVTNWKLSVSERSYRLGQTVTIESTYTKNHSAIGTAERYLECRNQSGIYVRYLLNKAVANRQSAKATGTGILVKIPDDIAEVTLPTECFFSITIDYSEGVSPRRAAPEYNRTENFTLSRTGKSKNKQAANTQSQSSTTTSRTDSTDSTGLQTQTNSVSSTQSTTSDTPQQKKTTTPKPQQPATEEEPDYTLEVKLPLLGEIKL